MIAYKKRLTNKVTHDVRQLMPRTAKAPNAPIKCGKKIVNSWFIATSIARGKVGDNEHMRKSASAICQEGALSNLTEPVGESLSNSKALTDYTLDGISLMLPLVFTNVNEIKPTMEIFADRAAGVNTNVQCLTHCMQVCNAHLLPGLIRYSVFQPKI